MQVHIEINATVLNNGQTEISIAGLKKSGENDSAGGDAKEDERINLVGSENHGEIGSGESADPVFSDNDSVSRGSERWVYVPLRFLKQFLMLRRRLDCAN